MSKSNVLFQLSGSIACYKACHVISRLVQTGYAVEVAATRNALRFVGHATFEGLTGKPVFCEAHESGRMMDHIHVAQWADLAILCPATANAINRLAAGIADDPIGNLFLAYDLKKPYLMAPAMNQQMLQHPATRASIETLKRYGVLMLETESGRQACGDVGEGRLLNPDAIFDTIIRVLEEGKKPT